jgi:CHAT domain-containing protein/Tfp pilus assembly protein PilF
MRTEARPSPVAQPAVVHVIRLTTAALAGVLAVAACRQPAGDGLVVEETLAGGAAGRAGITTGDVLQRWEVTTPDGARRHGMLTDTLALRDTEIEEAPRGTLILHGHRRGARLSWTMSAADWRLLAAPALETDTVRHRYEKIRRDLLGGNGDAAAEAVILAGEIQRTGRVREACALLLHVGDLYLQAKRWRQATAAFENVRSLAAADSDLVTRAWTGEAMAAHKGNELMRADAGYREAVSGCERLPERAVRFTCAFLHAQAAVVAYQRGELDASEKEWRRSLEISERIVPRSLPAAKSLLGLGAVAAVRGRLDEADEYYEKASALAESVAPESATVARSLSNRGHVARHRGDLATAEDFYRRGLAVFEKVDPEGSELAAAIQALGLLARRRGDLDAAETYLRRTLGILEAQSPDSPALASCLINLGGLHEDREERERAESYYRRALAINERVAPDGTEMAVTLANLASVTAAAGDTAGAVALHERALAIRRRRAPRSLEVAKTLAAMGRLALADEDPVRATRLHKEALGIRRRLSPGSAAEAESLHDLGTVLRRQGRKREALVRWTEALAVLDTQRSRFSESAQGRGTFGVRNTAFFADLVELAAELGEREQAFHIVERWRARGFLAMLAERELTFATADVPHEVLREQRESDVAYDAAQSRLARLQPGRDDAAIDKTLAQIEEQRQQRARTAAALRRASPRLGSLQEPVPLDLAGARRALDPGTRLLVYAVGAERTLLFVAPDVEDAKVPALTIAVLPLGRTVLEQRITAFRELISRGRQSAVLETALSTQARRLFDDIIGPVRSSLAGARRLLIVPDGPLHALPFAALAIADGPRYIAEEWPLHVAASATVYAEIKKQPPPARRDDGLTLLAFGDPRYGEGPASPAADGWMLARAQSLVPLPATRKEVESIAALYPGTSRAYLGPAATEARAKAEMPQARLLHFACHGLLDARFPLDSALALSPGENGDNGLLQAWEVIERVRLDADLVTLSACETGLGRNIGGEGLIGLARAFQYAGARSVLASLWEVSDRSTALLMERFYGGLKRGLSKDEALRAAQAEVRQQAAYAHPYHWAAFQLSGLWN